METWYLLYEGSSSDGRGAGSYCGRTVDKEEAKAHYAEVKSSPYNTGRVVVVTDNSEEVASCFNGW